MEPPSPVNSDQSIQGGSISDDPLSCTFQRDSIITSESLIIVSSIPVEDQSGSVNIVCAYSARTGLSYLGTVSPIQS